MRLSVAEDDIEMCEIGGSDRKPTSGDGDEDRKLRSFAKQRPSKKYKIIALIAGVIAIISFSVCVTTVVLMTEKKDGPGSGSVDPGGGASGLKGGLGEGADGRGGSVPTATPTTTPTATMTATPTAAPSASGGSGGGSGGGPVPTVTPTATNTATPTVTPTATPTATPATNTPTTSTTSPSTGVEPGFVKFNLPDSSQDRLVLLWKKINLADIEVARSYDKHDWEGLPPNPVTPVCMANACHVIVAEAEVSTLRLQWLNRTLGEHASNVTAVRLLRQGTFGATRASLAEFQTMHGGSGALTLAGASAWIDAQIALPATSHRAYYRERSNPPWQGNDQAAPSRLACEIGARYHAYTFSRADINKIVIVDPGEQAGVYTLRVDGVLFTEVPSWLGTAHSSISGSLPAATSHTICDLVYKHVGDGLGRWFPPRKIGGRVRIGPAGGGCKTTTDWENPAIEFSSANSSTTQACMSVCVAYVRVSHWQSFLSFLSY
jgi:hypothetical protein